MRQLTNALAELHDTYADAVNRAIAQDRHELVTSLEQEFADRSLRLVLDHGLSSAPRG